MVTDNVKLWLIKALCDRPRPFHIGNPHTSLTIPVVDVLDGADGVAIQSVLEDHAVEYVQVLNSVRPLTEAPGSPSIRGN